MQAVKTALAVAWMLLLPGLLALPSQARPLSEIRQSKELRICIAPEDPTYAIVEPPDCRENCKFTGLIHDEALAFAQTLGAGVQPKWLRVNWDEQFFNKDGQTVRDASYVPELLASGKCDFYPTHLTKTEWRLKKMDFVTLFPGRMMVIVNKSAKPLIRHPRDLGGRVAAVQKDTSHHTWLQDQNRSAFLAHPVQIRFLRMADGVAAVDAGQVDFSISDPDLAIASTRLLKNIMVAFPVGPSDEVGWAFRKQDKDLQLAVQAFFDGQRKQPGSELNRIWKKYFGRSLNEFIALIVAVK